MGINLLDAVSFGLGRKYFSQTESRSMNSSKFIHGG